MLTNVETMMDLPTPQDMAACMDLVEGAAAEGLVLTDEQRINALSGALRSALKGQDHVLTVLAEVPAEVLHEAGLTADNLMLLRSGHALNTQILDYCGSS